MLSLNFKPPLSTVTPPFLVSTPFLGNFLQPPPFLQIFENLNPPFRKGGSELCKNSEVTIALIISNVFHSYS